jgi:pyruvate carboxylase
MLFRGSNAVGYSNYPDNVVAGFVKHAAASGMDIFRIFDSLNYLPNLRVAMEAVRETHAVCEAAICYTGNILDEKRDKFSLKYYISLAKELEKMGAHFIAIKDMAGLCRPAAAKKLVQEIKEAVGLPVHFHTHDTSGISAASVLRAAEAGADIVDLAIASMSGSTSQPNLNSVVAALQHTSRDPGIDLDTLNDFSDYWERVREYYSPFDIAPRTGSAEVYLHEMPGGQYTNLREQAASMGVSHRWPEIARLYSQVNQLFGDIVKVTPSSKVVGDMALFLFSRGIHPEDVVNLEPGVTPFPESVIGMFNGELGWPQGGWPEPVWRVVLGEKKFKDAKARYELAMRKHLPANAGTLEAADLEKIRENLAEKIKRPAADDDLYSYLMYPEVFATFEKVRQDFSDLSVLPTPAFFYGLHHRQEISVTIEQGKTLIIRLVNVSEAEKDGRRTVTVELNGMTRETFIADKHLAPKAKLRPKADLKNPLQIPAPIPGLIASIAVSVGHKVSKGDKLLMIEAMKMQTTVSAPVDGVVDEIHAALSETVESKDLLLTLRAAT